jgi:hypothetical protein
MRSLVTLPVFLALGLAASSPASASEEMIHPWTLVTVRVDGGRSFGAVEVTAAAAPRAGAPLASLEVTLSGRRVPLPAKALAGLPDVDLSTIAIHTEVGYDRLPWLYVVFQVPANRRAAGFTQQWVYFSFQGGKLMKRSVKSRTPQNQYKFEDRPVK